jgi:hypothetical protein
MSIKPIILFHGTSALALKGISKSGLKAPYVSEKDSVVFLTDNLGIARDFASVVAEDDESRAVVLRVTIRNPENLEADLFMFRMPPPEVLRRKFGGMSVKRYGNLFLKNKIETPKDSKDWKTSLRVISSVLYKGMIPPKDIEVLHGDRWIPLVKF